MMSNILYIDDHSCSKRSWPAVPFGKKRKKNVSSKAGMRPWAVLRFPNIWPLGYVTKYGVMVCFLRSKNLGCTCSGPGAMFPALVALATWP